MSDYSVSVRLGEHDLATELDCQTSADGENYCADPVQDIPVSWIMAHLSYNQPRYANDIGLVRLAHLANMKPGNTECSSAVTH